MTEQAAEKTAADPSIYGELQDALPDLMRSLHRNGYQAGVDEFLAAQSLLEIWKKKELLPADVICASLAGLFSTNTDEQERFQPIFNQWYRHTAPSEELFEDGGSAAVSEPPRWSQTVQPGRKLRLAVALIVFTLFALLVVPDNPVKTDEPELPPPPTAGGTTGMDQPGQTQTGSITAPRLPPAPVIPPARYFPDWTSHIRYLPWLPFVAWGGWLAIRLRYRFLTLSRRRTQPDTDFHLEALSVKKGRGGLFPAGALKKVMHRWRRFFPFRSQRLDEAETVRSTLEQNGYFQPSFRERLLPPEYVLLIDRRHYDDYTAFIAAELKGLMIEEGLFVTLYQYDTDPRYCWSTTETARCFSMAQLADRHRGQHLLVIGEASGFFLGGNSGRKNWGPEGAWHSKILLSNDAPEDWGSNERRLLDEGFNIAPFTRRGLQELAAGERREAAFRIIAAAKSMDYRDAGLPGILDPEAYDWLDPRRPGRNWRRRSIAALKTYLGLQGYRLLAATAAYPELNWALTLALDQQLGHEGDEYREIRLRKLARLPWLRHGRIPDSWRRILLRSLTTAQVEQINDAYQALLDDRDGEVTNLPVAVPDWRSAKKEQREWIATAEAGNPVRDPVFASVIRGRKPGLLEFPLSKRFSEWAPPQYWQGWLGRGAVGLLLASLFAWGLHASWQGWGRERAEREAVFNMKNVVKTYNVRIDYQDEKLRASAQTLQKALNSWGFKADLGDLLLQPEVSKEQAQEKKPAKPGNRIKFSGRDHHDIAELAERRLRYLSYGAPVIRVENPEMEDNRILIQLRSPLQPGSVYSDYLQPSFNVETHRDRLQSGAQGPEMVKIAAGCFDMGSPDSDKDRQSFEEPQHRVCIEKPFFLGRFEVSFAEYRVFAEATGRRLPNDEGWVRQSRPVINVSWEDANAYAQWLSKETGKRYRLPSEAEWEYAARAGTETVYWWGDEVEAGWANCDGCGTRWGGQQSAPAGSFPPNGFGLYDTAGNVWEWVQDCWHRDYQNAPADGRAWETEDDGDCGRRVIRGGSWSYGPGYVRSADRFFDPLNGVFNLGFRLAQD